MEHSNTNTSFSSKAPNTNPETIHEENDNISETSKEIATHTLDHNIDNVSDETPRTFTSPSTAVTNASENEASSARSHVPVILIGRPSLNDQSVIISQPFRILSNLPSPMSLDIQSNQPQTLFLQALTKLNESSINIAVLNHLKSTIPQINSCTVNQTTKVESSAPKSLEPSPPDSLTNAPPSYSFVLRQMAQRRRPRLMGTFIPSPSFVQHTPPPNYAAAFDIYVENPIPQPPPTRVYDFGFTPMPAICSECGYIGLTVVTGKITMCTHLCSLFLCLFCCWFCAPLPYILSSCKDVYHYCRNCGHFLGMYCPTNPESIHRSEVVAGTRPRQRH